MTTPAGGSSSVLSNADWASSFMRSAASMMATRAPPSTGMRASSAMSSRTPGYLASGPPITTWRPGPVGPRRCRSGWPLFSIIRHDRHVRQGRSAGGAVHSRPAARSRARVVFPTPSGPVKRTACGTGPRTIAAIAPSAPAWPRVLAPSIETIRPAPSTPPCESCGASERSSRFRRLPRWPPTAPSLGRPSHLTPWQRPASSSL